MILAFHTSRTLVYIELAQIFNVRILLYVKIDFYMPITTVSAKT